jgi:hypothetical protein
MIDNVAPGALSPFSMIYFSETVSDVENIFNNWFMRLIKKNSFFNILEKYIRVFYHYIFLEILAYMRRTDFKKVVLKEKIKLFFVFFFFNFLFRILKCSPIVISSIIV